MTADIWNDGTIVFRDIEVSLTDARELSNAGQWEGTFTIPAGEEFHVSGNYRLKLNDGRSADIIPTHILRRERVVVHFRAFVWQDKPRSCDKRRGKAG